MLLGGNANSQILATLCSPALDDETAIFRRHSHKKTVGPFTGSIARLKCSFHGFTPGIVFQESIL
jgi:orotate phosphoribosyltransferase-like protein